MTIDQEQQLIADVKEIKLAVVGSEKIGIAGLVADVRKLKKWQYNINLRIMFISGFVTCIGAVIKYLFTK